MLENLRSAARQETLGMILHAKQRIMLVLNAHDLQGPSGALLQAVTVNSSLSVSG